MTEVDRSADPERFADGRPLELLILQATPFCNIDCEYCYLPARTDRRVMSENTLRRSVSAVFESQFVAPKVEIVWHAGEPLVLPIAYYEHALPIIDEVNAGRFNVTYQLQTNATLLNPEWCHFFLRRHVKIGVSIDGPAFLHDRYRRRRSGRGTFADVMRGIDILREHGVKFSVISVVTAETLDYADEFFDFLVDLGASSIGLNLEASERVNQGSSLDGQDVRVCLFWQKLIRRWDRDGRRIHIREFELIFERITAYFAGQVVRPQSTAAPFSIITVDVDGNFATFSPELLGQETLYGQFLFGNLTTGSIADCLSTPRFLKIAEEIERGVERCRATCEYFSMCGGGSPSNKLTEVRTFDATVTGHCRRTRQILTDEIMAYLEARIRVPSHLANVP